MTVQVGQTVNDTFDIGVCKSWYRFALIFQIVVQVVVHTITSNTN